MSTKPFEETENAKYLVFTYERYYPQGATGDLRYIAASLQEAIEAIADLDYEHDEIMKVYPNGDLSFVIWYNMDGAPTLEQAIQLGKQK